MWRKSRFFCNFTARIKSKATMKKLTTLISVCIFLLAMQGCNKEFFDKEKVEEILELSFHNDTIDANHTWRLMSEHNIQVTTTVNNVERIELLTADPHESDKAELLAENSITTGVTITMSYSVHLAQQQLYAAAVDSNGSYYIVPFTKGEARVSIGSDVVPFSRLQIRKPNRQEVYYCFCNGYPQPSTTWDFNDLVLRLSRQVLDNYTLRIYVTLAAVGTTMQEAAALRLVGVGYDEIESLTCVDDKRFSTNERYGRNIITQTEDLLRGRNGEAVINLFDDAHMAMSPRGIDQTGQVMRLYYNVSNSMEGEYFIRNEVTVAYDVRFKQSGVVDDVTYDKLDPFMVYGYNGAIWEIHKYAYKFDEVLFQYYGGNPFNYDTGFTWALEVPYSWFRYPLEGNAIGGYQKGILSGAYRDRGHSFGQWAAHRDQSVDWYLYPMNNLVY